MTTTEHTAPAAAGANPLKSAAERIALVRAELDRLRAETQRLQADVERLTRERDEAIDRGAQALERQDQNYRARLATAERLAEAVHGLIPEGWDTGAMDHMPGIADARAALAAWEASRG
ncbi:conserved protein of unknown function [Rhodovastum atsumiense]|uniref:Nucleotide exchange factor GrpE n=1 Tax=Rhodovastum atsumiense TaxID=504468 RepID=A0A5M6II49_9PROT|nr:hypothetical protein [Rhodovastum atsumiense]KAA5607940.1 hypothetical protein F1189_31460 [Rhodovastum atsumiense]CAH2603814.1 conserved protein of unknown function [Rhodovastum atsumiense]